MTKAEFLHNLEKSLAGLPREEIAKTLDYYSEIIDDALEDGIAESEAISRLESVDEIAEKVINETPLRKIVRAGVKKHKFNAAAFALILISSPLWLPFTAVVLSILFSLYLTVWAIVAVFFIVFAALIVSGIVMLVLSPFLLPFAAVKAMFAFGSALICAGMSVFVFLLAVQSAKLTAKATVYLCRCLKRMFIRKGSAGNWV